MINKMGPKISIVTVVRNSKNLLESTIKSVINQTYQNLEYIVIDGASNDGTIDVIKKYDKFITKWISEPDNGIYSAMNKGLSLATGDYVWFMNAGDEIYTPSVLEEVINSEKDVDFYYGNELAINDSGSIINVPRENINWKNAFQFGAGDVRHQAVIVKKFIAEEFNEKYKSSGDIDWMIRVLKKSKKIFHYKKTLDKFLLEGFSSRHWVVSKYEYCKIIFKHHLYKSFFKILPKVIILYPIDRGIGRIGLFLKKRSPKVYYFLKK